MMLAVPPQNEKQVDKYEELHRKIFFKNLKVIDLCLFIIVFVHKIIKKNKVLLFKLLFC